jgi:hypothetical protein
MLDICVDFDGTIVDHAFPEIGKPVPYAIDTLEWLQELEFINLILLTMRSTNMVGSDYLTEAVKYTTDNGINFKYINENPTQLSWTTSNKVYGKYYIDNAAIGCPLIKVNGFLRPCVDWLKVKDLLIDQFQYRGYH